MLVLLGVFVLGSLGYWFVHRSYMREMKNLSAAVENKDYYKILDALSRLPKTQILLDSVSDRAITGDGITSVSRPTRGEINAQIAFPPIRNFQAIEERTARIYVALPRASDFSNTMLMARGRAEGNIVVGGHLSTRLQFELYDVNGRMLRGPKVVAQKDGHDFMLIVRPTVSEPIPTGFADPEFDAAQVTKVAIRLTLGIPKTTQSGQYFQGKLHFDKIVAVRDLPLIAKFFPIPDKNRVTQDRLNLGYEMRKREWRKEPKEFFVGINYPWREYGWDFGRNPWGTVPPRNGWAAHEEELTNNFLTFRKAGITHVRMYLFCDFRSAVIETPNGLALDQYVIEDTEAMLRAAHKTGIKLIPVLLDFSIGNTAVGEYVENGNTWSKPKLVFSPRKYQLFSQMMVPYLKQLEVLNTKYDHPIAYLELMNEPDNLALLMVPGYYESLKAWLTDLAVVIHEETTMKVTLGARSFADFRRWWNGVPVDAYQFHFYVDMMTDMPPVAINVPRDQVGIDQPLFCGELDPYLMHLNIPRLKSQGYDGVLLWGFNSGDGFKVNLDALKKIVDELNPAPEPPAPKEKARTVRDKK